MTTYQLCFLCHHRLLLNDFSILWIDFSIFWLSLRGHGSKHCREKKTGNLQPIYHSGDKLSSKGLTSKGFEKLIRNLLPQVKDKLTETLTPQLMYDYRLILRDQAIQSIHLPEDTGLY